MNEIEYCHNRKMPPIIKYDELDGQEHIVAETVIMSEGVWSGSKGPVLYNDKVLNSDPDVWNHMPIIVIHPEDEKESGRSVQILKKSKIGVILNTRVDDNRWVTESWINVKRANEIDPSIISNLKNNKSVNCSTGLKAKLSPQKGFFKGKAYEYILEEYTPDHLAVLPDNIKPAVADSGILKNEEFIYSNEVNKVSDTNKVNNNETQIVEKIVEKPVEKIVEKMPVYNNLGEFLKLADEKYQSELNEMVSVYNQVKEEKVNIIFSNPKNKFTKEQLVAKPMNELENICSLIEEVAVANAETTEKKEEAINNSYIAQGNTPTPKAKENKVEIELMPIPEVNYNK